MNEQDELILPPTNSIEENARIWAEHFNSTILPGHGIFFDFNKLP